jgi:hypothetical protein
MESEKKVLEARKLYELKGYDEYFIYFDDYVEIGGRTWVKAFDVTQFYKCEKTAESIKRAREKFYCESEKFVYGISGKVHYINLESIESIREICLEDGVNG